VNDRRPRKSALEETARVLRECAVDLIRASDLFDSDQFPAVDSALRRIDHVIAELELVAPQLRWRVQRLEPWSRRSAAAES
jgi:hypothetical protein